MAYAAVWDGVDLSALTSRAWMSLIYLGWGASLFAYTLWCYLPARAAVKQLALSIVVQPVVGAAIG